VLGLAALVGTLVLSLPGVKAVRADDLAPGANTARVDESAPDGSVGPPANASYEGFVEHLQRRGRPVEVESVGPTCNAGNPLAAEMAHRRAMVRLRARLMAEARARAAAGEAPEVVVLNGSGYNYRSPDSVQPPPPAPPAD
jgi:hypothetical protein